MTKPIPPHISEAAMTDLKEKEGRKAGHTPGPWEHHPDGRITDAAGWLLANVYVSRLHAGERAENMANARLIALAPEMLDTLRAVARACALHDADLDDGSDWDRAFKRVLEMIARAEGRYTQEQALKDFTELSEDDTDG